MSATLVLGWRSRRCKRQQSASSVKANTTPARAPPDRRCCAPAPSSPTHRWRARWGGVDNGRQASACLAPRRVECRDVALRQGARVASGISAKKLTRKLSPVHLAQTGDAHFDLLAGDVRCHAIQLGLKWWRYLPRSTSHRDHWRRNESPAMIFVRWRQTGRRRQVELAVDQPVWRVHPEKSFCVTVLPFTATRRPRTIG